YCPDLSTFFVNSTAHFQHKYWRNMDPETFRLKPGANEQKQYADAVLFGYQAMDNLIGKALALAGSETTILLASALSQQPYLKMEESGGKRFYRPHNFDKFINFVGLDGVSKVAPVMSEQFHIYFEDEPSARRGSELLARVRVDGRDAMHIRREGRDVFTGCHLFDRIPREARIEVAGTQRSQPSFHLFYEADCLKSGMHHPDGLFWIQTPERAHRVIPGYVALRSVAPTILRLFDVPVPSHMPAPPLPVSLREAKEAEL